MIYEKYATLDVIIKGSIPCIGGLWIELWCWKVHHLNVRRILFQLVEQLVQSTKQRKAEV